MQIIDLHPMLMYDKMLKSAIQKDNEFLISSWVIDFGEKNSEGICIKKLVERNTISDSCHAEYKRLFKDKHPTQYPLYFDILELNSLRQAAGLDLI